MAKILNILSIVLPLLIVVLGLIRYYSDGKRNFGGAITFMAVLLLLIGLFRYFFIGNGGGSTHSGPPPESLPVSKHSEAFNNSMEAVLNAYYKITEAFVNADSTMINNAGTELRMALDSLKIDELKKDSLIYLTALDPYNNAKAEVVSILADPSIEEKRGSLNILSFQLRDLWSTVKYDREKAYWQECSTAFGEDKPGNWLSRNIEGRNPYTKELDCSVPKDTIKFDPPVDTAQKK